VIQSIVAQSLPGEPDKVTAIAKRVRAAIAGEMEVGSSQGPEDLRRVLEIELAPFGLERIELRGDTVLIGSQAAASLGLAVHELATNAMKYGSLSGASGQVTLAWWTADNSAFVRWTESGGPPVRPPSRRGFGSIFLSRVIKAGGGSIEVGYQPSGVDALIAFPIHGSAKQSRRSAA
jgi:two-component sensor histidine kinase